MKKIINWIFKLSLVGIVAYICINILVVIFFIPKIYEQHLLNESLINLRNLWPALVDENTFELYPTIDLNRVRKLPHYTGDINGIPNLMICPISGKPYVYKPFSKDSGQKIDFEHERRIIAYSPEPTWSGKRAALEGDEGTVLTLTDEQFKQAVANNFIYRLTKP